MTTLGKRQGAWVADDRAGTVWLALGAAVAAIAATILVIAVPLAGVAFLGLIFVAVTIRFLRFYVVMAGLTLPLSAILVIPLPGAQIPICDIFAIIAILSYLLTRASKEQPRTSIWKPIAGGVVVIVPYVVIGAVGTMYNSPDLGTWLTWAQRVELVFVWLLLGVVTHRAALMKPFLSAFVSVCAVLSLAWLATPGSSSAFGIQKNPAGGFIASAILIVLLSDMKAKFRVPLVILLSAGLLSTGSRGSILGLVAAGGVLMLFARQWKRVIVPLALCCLAAVVVFNYLPPDVSARLLSQNAAGAYNVDIRQRYVDDAISQQEVVSHGVGIGNYLPLDSYLQRVETKDPHNVYVLALVEGGWWLAIAFGLLAVGSILWMLFKPKSPLVVLALTVQVSILAHAFVDVYWVRGTPSLGWMLIGAAAAFAFQAKVKKRELAEQAPASGGRAKLTPTLP